MCPQLGISLFEPKLCPLFKIHRFRVFSRESFSLLEPHMQKRNLNYQIFGDNPYERVVIRVFLDEAKQVYKSRYYYLPELDQELVSYLVMAFLEWLKLQYVFKKNHHIKELQPWK